MSFFQAETRRTSQEFQGLVTSTLKPLESQCSKDADVFVNTSSQCRNYIDQWGNLNFIIRFGQMILSDMLRQLKNLNYSTDLPAYSETPAKVRVFGSKYQLLLLNIE